MEKKVRDREDALAPAAAGRDPCATRSTRFVASSLVPATSLRFAVT